MIFRFPAATAALALLAACTSHPRLEPPSAQPVIAITVDDIPDHGALPLGVTRTAIAREVVAALKAAGVPAHGFINGAPASPGSDSLAALELWAAEFPVANHSWSHPNLNVLTAEQYQQEIALNEPLLMRLSRDGDWRWFRYPFLAEGDDPAKRLAVRHYLAERGYRIAAVTMDFWDWAYNDPYARCAAKGDAAAIAALEREWLAAARHKAIAARQMAQALHGRDIPYVLLTHIGAFDARMFPRMIRLYREMGFRFVTLEEAQKDPAYARDNDPDMPPAAWTLEGQMAEKGLPLPMQRTPEIDLERICT